MNIHTNAQFRALFTHTLKNSCPPTPSCNCAISRLQLGTVSVMSRRLQAKCSSSVFARQVVSTHRPVPDDYKLVLVFSTLPKSDLLQLQLPETLLQIHILWYNIKVLNCSSARSSRLWLSDPGMLVRPQPLVSALMSRPYQPAQLHWQPTHFKLHVVAVYFGGLFVRNIALNNCCLFNVRLHTPIGVWIESRKNDTPLIDHLVMRQFVSGPLSYRLATAAGKWEFVTESPVLGRVREQSAGLEQKEKEWHGMEKTERNDCGLLLHPLQHDCRLRTPSSLHCQKRCWLNQPWQSASQGGRPPWSAC